MEHPKISIVTPSFNQGKYLEETILSVLDQKYPNLEYIIIDGGSTDNSVEIIKKYERHLTFWVSEKDKGQSDAINKGLKHVTGDLFNWINSDDLLEQGALLRIAETYRQNPEKKLFMFGLSYLNGTKKTARSWNLSPADGLLFYCDPTIMQPSMFYTASALKALGPLNNRLHYAMDYEWLIKFLFTYGARDILRSDVPVSVFRLHEDAKTSLGNERFADDIASMLHSISVAAGLRKYSGLLKKGFHIYPEYSFSLPKGHMDPAIAERMVVYFLLQHSHRVYKRSHYIFAKEMLEVISFADFTLSPEETGWLQLIKKNTGSPSWLLFRARRKLDHIFNPGSK